MGSGSFLVAALRYLVEALHRSLEHHGRIKPKGDRETVVTLPFGTPATGEEHEELLPLPPEDDRFPQMLRSRLARHVVERCLYGVDRNPMAVELARLALWVETLDRDLPFEYLDHKLKVGNSLVGCWLRNVEDYPIRAWEREAGDGTKGERTKALAAVLKQAKAELPDWIRALAGAKTFFDDVSVQPEELVARVRATIRGPAFPPARGSRARLPRSPRERGVHRIEVCTGYLVRCLVLANGMGSPASAALRSGAG